LDIPRLTHDLQGAAARPAMRPVATINVATYID